MLKIKDYYEILGVSKDATDSDLKKGYQKMALQFHPDKNNAPGADEVFKSIKIAYDVLSNAKKRKQYDLCGPKVASCNSGERKGRSGFSKYDPMSNTEKRKQHDKKESVIGKSSYEPNQLKRLKSRLIRTRFDYYENRYSNQKRRPYDFQFDSWNNWRKNDGFMCRDTNDCNWIDKNLYCQNNKELQPIVSYSSILISIWSV